MRSLFLSFLIIGSMLAPAKALATVLAKTSLWLQNKFSNKTCQDLDQDDYQHIQNYLSQQGCKLTSSTSSGQSRALLSKDMNAITEYQFFNSLALKNLEQLDCKISSINQFSTDDSLIEMRSQEIFDKLPFIKEQRQLANDSHHDYLNKVRENNSFASTCSQATGEFRKKCYNELDRQRADEKELEKKWQVHRAMALSFTASLWNGPTLTMSTLIEKLAQKNPLPSKEEIVSEFKKQIPLIKSEITENKNELLKQSSIRNNIRSFDNLTDATKRQLLEVSLDNGLFTEAYKNKDPSMIKMLCHLEGKYTKGRDKLNNVVSNSTLILGGFAGLLSKIPVVLRAGQVGNVLTKARGSSAIVGSLGTGLDAAAVAESIHASCFSNTLNLTVNNSCPKNANAVKQNEVQKFQQDNCILNAALGMAPVGVLAASTAYKSLSAVMEKYKEAYYLSENKSIKEILKTDAIQVHERIARALMEKPRISADLFVKNQQEAEVYFHKNNLKVSEGKIESKVSESEITRIDTAFQESKVAQANNINNYSRILNSRINKRNKFLNDIKELEKEIELIQSNPTADQAIKLQRTKDKLNKEKAALEKVEEEISSVQQMLANSIESGNVRTATLQNKKDDLLKKQLVPRPSSVDIQAISFGIRELSATDLRVLESTKNLRKVYVFDEAPKARPFSSAAAPFWQHPEFNNRFEEAKKMGVTIVLDPQNMKGAFYHPSSKSIYLNPNAPFSLLEHEFTHAQFDAYLLSKISGNSQTIDTKFREGTKLSMILPEYDIAKIGNKNIAYLQNLLEKYNSTLTVNEALAVKKELTSMGWRPLSSEFYFAKIYGGWYRVNELLTAQKAANSAKTTAVIGAAGPLSSVEFTAQQAKMLDQELVQVSINATMFRSSREIQNQIAGVRKNIANGNIPMALATWRKVQDQLQKQEPDNTTYFYNENGGFIRMNSKESRFEYTNLNSQKTK